MTIQSGENIILKLGDGAEPEVFSSVGGLRSIRVRLNHDSVFVKNISSNIWQQTLDKAGENSLVISALGLFGDSVTEESLRAKAFLGKVANYQIEFGNGDVLQGAFLISRYERNGSVGAADGYVIALESAGEISYF